MSAQTPVLTNRWDLRDIVVACRMFDRWRQENFFKYMRQEFPIDALSDYQVERDDPERSVPNPARKAAAIARVLPDRGVVDWLWEGIERGEATDSRFGPGRQ